MNISALRIFIYMSLCLPNFAYYSTKISLSNIYRAIKYRMTHTYIDKHRYTDTHSHTHARICISI